MLYEIVIQRSRHQSKGFKVPTRQGVIAGQSEYLVGKVGG